MDIRQSYLIEQAAIADVASMVYSLNAVKPITCIDLIFIAHSDTPDDGQLPLAKSIINVALVDGGKQVQGGDAFLLQGMNYGMKSGLQFITTGESADEKYARIRVRLSFGLYRGDPNNFLDPADFQNLQIKFQSNLTVGAGDYTSGTLLASIIVHTIEQGAGARQATMFIKKIATPVIAAAAENRLDMPTDFPWHTLGIFSANSSNVALHPFPTVARVKINQNNGGYVPFDKLMLDILAENIDRLGYFKMTEVELRAWAVDTGHGLAAPNITLKGQYCAPYGGVFIPFCQERENTCWAPEPSGGVELVQTGGTTGGSPVVMLAQLVSNP